VGQRLSLSSLSILTFWACNQPADAESVRLFIIIIIIIMMMILFRRGVGMLFGWR
jgi:hypothetical protein